MMPMLSLAAALFALQSALPSQPSAAERPVIPIEFSGISTSDPPNRPGAWTVVVARQGGIAGFGRSFVTTTSAGAVTCGGQPAPCRSTLDQPELSALSALIARSLPIFETSQSTFCSDCARTFVLLTRRDEAGRLLRHTASWDVTTQSKVPADLVRLVSTTTSNALGRGRGR